MMLMGIRGGRRDLHRVAPCLVRCALMMWSALTARCLRVSRRGAR